MKPEPAGENAALREAVRRKCLEQFARRFGRPWDPQLARFIRSDENRRQDLQEALQIQEQLRVAIARAVEFVKRPREHAAPLGMGFWVPRFVAPLADHDFLRKREPPRAEGKPPSERHRFIEKCNAVDFIDARRRLDAAELAIVWLLGGGFPDDLTPSTGAPTPARVIQAETRLFRAALREVGSNATRGAYRARFEQDDAGHWSALVRVDAERTVVSEGRTLDEAHQRLREALALLLDDDGDAR